ncbi:uncharacterized protein [Typha latifolia]|uniref:uncharacterized protein n=1 Tax=Typha latifolia TaxID=4733 RepID=UPI003C2FE0A6
MGKVKEKIFTAVQKGENLGSSLHSNGTVSGKNDKERNIGQSIISDISSSVVIADPVSVDSNYCEASNEYDIVLANEGFVPQSTGLQKSNMSHDSLSNSEKSRNFCYKKRRRCRRRGKQNSSIIFSAVPVINQSNTLVESSSPTDEIKDNIFAKGACANSNRSDITPVITSLSGSVEHSCSRKQKKLDRRKFVENNKVDGKLIDKNSSCCEFKDEQVQKDLPCTSQIAAEISVKAATPQKVRKRVRKKKVKHLHERINHDQNSSGDLQVHPAEERSKLITTDNRQQQAVADCYMEHVLSSELLMNQEKKLTLHVSPERPLISYQRKKLLILDLNGVLADVILDFRKLLKAPKYIDKKAVFKRPFCDEFLKFCFEKFNIGIWSSRKRKNVDYLVDYLMGDMKHHLLFCWDQSKCTITGFNTVENVHKPLVLKEMRKLWNKDEHDLPWEKGEYSPLNTLLVDDSPYKALCNPPHTAIFPYPFHYSDEDDHALGLGGEFQVYLEQLSMADDVQKYVETHPFGQRSITTANPSWRFYQQIIEKVDSSFVSTC